MLHVSPSARQPHREAWPLERLQRERSIALGSALEPASLATYSSALQSYLTICRAHALPVDPTPDTLSFYTVYMCHHINPRSVDHYLSGICNQLEPFYPDVRAARKSAVVARTLKGCKKLRASPVRRKAPLSRDDMRLAVRAMPAHPSHDDLLFTALLLTGFHALMRLGELVQPDTVALHDWRKVIMRTTVTIYPAGYGFHLPYHKADRLFEGNRIIVRRRPEDSADPDRAFRSYLESRDARFHTLPQLWLCSNGTVPTRRWFLERLRALFPSADIAGQSLRSGGATSLAEEGTPPDLIQAIGRWASETFRIYIRKNPTVLAAMLVSRNGRFLDPASV
jgi:hypothetical protein